MPPESLRVLVDLNVPRAPASTAYRDQLAALLPDHEIHAYESMA